MTQTASIGKLERHLVSDAAGQPVAVHVRTPAGEPPSRAIVLLPAIAGVNEYVAGRAEDLGRAGYLVVVVDYFGRDAARPDLSTPERIGAAVAAVDDRRVLADIGLSLDWLAARGIARQQVGVVGFCMGGSYAVLAASQADAPACAVAYYGQLRYRERTERKPADPIAVASQLRAPFLGHFGDMDRLISAEEIAEFRERLRGAQCHYEVRTYEGAPHAFDEWFRPPVFRPVASAAAWNSTLVFLDWHLRQRRPA
jgi:carboxymethylenebutenolidase